MAPHCPICDEQAPNIIRQAEGIDYHLCPHCECIFVQQAILDLVDSGNPVQSRQEYWRKQIHTLRERSYSSSLARVVEAVLYARIPINTFVDIGTAHGFLLDAVSTYLPRFAGKFFGVEASPPLDRSRNDHYIVGSLADVSHSFEAGVCLEVAQHLTPKMLDTLAADLAQRSVPGSFYLFSTALADYVRREAQDCLELFQKGHLMAYSIKSLEMIFEPHGFTVRPIRGKPWAFTVEYRSDRPKTEDVIDRIWTPCPENKALLNDPMMGGVMYILGIESARAYV